MRKLSITTLALIALPAYAAEEPYGWDFCTAPENGLSVSACVAHVRADCAGAVDAQACLAGHYEGWFGYDANATLADAVDKDASGGRLTLDSLADAIGRATPKEGKCAETDVDCLLADTIKRALGNHALRQAE
ncbi:MAG: hypothetical protein AB8B85_21510 [Paracoccaceae bacterium]